MIHLLPCPFCGATPTFDLSDVDEYGQAWDRLSCPSCHVYVERALEKDGSGSDVVARWNTRSNPEDTALLDWADSEGHHDVSYPSLRAELRDKGGKMPLTDQPLMPNCYGAYNAFKRKERECELCSHVDTCRGITLAKLVK